VAVALKITSPEGLEFLRVAGLVVLERTFSSTNGPGSWVIQRPVDLRRILDQLGQQGD
jgi:hypothetical protein